MMHRRMISALLLSGFLAIAGCDESLSTLTGPTPQLRPAFSSIQAQIFENSDSSGRPACVTCHNTANRFFAGRLALEHDVAYDNLVNVASALKPSETRVVPADPERSYLIHKLEGR